MENKEKGSKKVQTLSVRYSEKSEDLPYLQKKAGR